MKNKIFIPIGVDCSVSHFLRGRRLRKEAYPFDWNVTPLGSAIELIENDFHDFLKFENLEFLPPTKRLLFKENGIDLEISDDVITPVICKRYGILFPHDFSGSGVSDYLEVKRKYDRRIQRLKETISNSDSVALVFHNGNLNDWQEQQYRYIEAAFEGMTHDELMERSGRLRERGYTLLPLSQLKASRASLIKRIANFAKRSLRGVGE